MVNIRIFPETAKFIWGSWKNCFLIINELCKGLVINGL